MIAKKALVASILALLGSCGENGEKTSPHDGDPRTSATGANATNASRKSSVAMDERQPGNPAEHDGVKVYRPKSLTNTDYDQNARTLIDLDTGDKLLISSAGHAGGPSQFGFSNEKAGPIAGGSFLSWSNQDVVVYNITSIVIAKDGGRSYRAREEYDISRIAEMFRALDDEQVRKARPIVGNIPSHNILVVDSRPKKISEVNPVSGQRKLTK